MTVRHWISRPRSRFLKRSTPSSPLIMKTRFLILLALLWNVTSHAQQSLTFNRTTGKILVGTNIFNANSNLIQAALGFNLPPIYGALNTLYVATNGVDGTAAIGQLERPWGTLKAAAAAAPNVGAMIIMLPGTHYLNGSRRDGSTNLTTVGAAFAGKTNLILTCMPGVQVLNTNSGDLIAFEACSNIVIRGGQWGYAAKPAAGVVSTSNPKGWSVFCPQRGNVELTFDGNELVNAPIHGIANSTKVGTMTRINIRNLVAKNIGTPVLTNMSTGLGAVVSLMGSSDVRIEGAAMTDYFRGIELDVVDVTSPSTGDGNTNVVARGNSFLRGSHAAVWSQPINIGILRHRRVRVADSTIEEVYNDGTIGTQIPTGVFFSGVSYGSVGETTFNLINRNPSPTAFGQAIQIGPSCDKIDIHDNRITTCGYGIDMLSWANIANSRPANVSIFNNLVDGCHGDGIRFAGRNTLVAGNRCLGNGLTTTASGIMTTSVTYTNSGVPLNMIVDGNYCYNMALPGTQDYGIIIDGANVLMGKNWCWSNDVSQVSITAGSPSLYGSAGITPRRALGPSTAITSTTATAFDIAPVLPLKSTQVGEVMRLHAIGRFTSAASPGNLTLKVKTLAGATLLDSGAIALPASQTDAGWQIEALFRINANSSTAAIVNGTVDIHNGGTAPLRKVLAHGSTGNKLDIDSDQTLQVEVTFSASGNSILCETMYLTTDL